MIPAFSSWQAFLAMGGYAFYVWLSVGCTLIALGALVVHTLIQHRQLLNEIRRRQSRECRIRTAQQRSGCRTGQESKREYPS